MIRLWLYHLLLILTYNLLVSSFIHYAILLPPLLKTHTYKKTTYICFIICSKWTLIHKSECESYHPRVEMGDMEDPLRWGNGEPSKGLRSWSICLYLGLYLIQRWRASQASGCCPVLVKLTARAIRAFRLFGCSSKHLFEQRQTEHGKIEWVAEFEVGLQYLFVQKKQKTVQKIITVFAI